MVSALTASSFHWTQLDDQTASSKSSPICPSDRAFAYGDGFFTTMGVLNGDILWQFYHQKRLIQHASALHLTLTEEQTTAIWRLAQASAEQIKHGIIKLVVTRPRQPVRGYGFSPAPADNTAQLWLGTLPTDPLLDASELAFNGFKLASYLGIESVSHSTHSPMPAVPLLQPAITAICLDARLSSHPRPLAGLKSLSRLDNAMASGELQRHRLADPNRILGEGLVRDIAGNWIEGTMSNVFYRLDDRSDTANLWYTPPIESAGVAGVMRSVLMDKLTHAGKAVSERPLTDTDLPHLKALFFCNAVRGVIPVKRLVCGSDTIELQNA